MSLTDELCAAADRGGAIARLLDQWVAVDPRGGNGLFALRSGAVIVDHDSEIDALCRRITEAERTSLTIVYCGRNAA